MYNFELKDSGSRQTFQTGAVRDTQDGKGRFDLLPAYAIRRLAIIFQRGSKKYQERNWEQGIPVSRFMDSALRHLFCYLDGMRDEDHLGQAMWNVACAIQTQEWVREGKLPEELDDLKSKPFLCPPPKSEFID